jgi:hypothetical protein
VLQPTPPAPPTPVTAASAASGSSTGIAAGGTGRGAGAGSGGSGYDPNAGAAPLRRDDLAGGSTISAAPTPSSTLGEWLMGFLGLSKPALPPATTFDLDGTALEAARRDAMTRLKGARGSVIFAVRISPTGMVLDALPKQATLPRQAVAAVRSAILGRRLFVPRGGVSDGATLDLPAITLG